MLKKNQKELVAQLRQQLFFSGLLEDENPGAGIPNVSLNFRSKRLSRRKIIIAFDDVTYSKQIEFNIVISYVALMLRDC